MVLKQRSTKSCPLAAAAATGSTQPGDEVALPPLVIGDLTIPVPIVQGGMGVGVSLAGLASAVSNEGGLGVISAVGIGMLETDFSSNFLDANLRALRDEIRRAKALTAGPLGVNVLVALSNYGSYAAAAASEGIDVVFSGAGLPLQLPEFVPEGAKTKLVPIVSSGRAARLLCRKWLSRYGRLPDAFVVEGPLAGGHLGFKTEQIGDPAYELGGLVRATVEAVEPFCETHGCRIPVIAAGGIFTGEDIRRMFALGAEGAQMGTRFVTTHECDVSDAFKQVYIDCGKEDVVLIQSPVGMPGRAVRNKFLDDVAAGRRKPVNCPFRCIVTCDGNDSPYCIALALVNAKRGNMARGFAFAGANAYRTDKVVSVHELMQSLIEEFREAYTQACVESDTAPLDGAGDGSDGERRRADPAG